MPVNYEQLRSQLKQAGKTLRLRQSIFSKAADAYTMLLKSESQKEDLAERIREALAGKPDTRCALPGDEPVGISHPLPSLPPVGIRLLACDGSQISPSRHDEISFGLINTAVVEYVVRSGRAPVISTMTKLLDFEALPSEDVLGVQRDAAEKRFLAEKADEAPRDIPVFAICDGPLELFTETPEMKENQKLKEDYIQSLRMLADRQAPAVGYIDRPRSDPVLRMLDLLGPGHGDRDPGVDDSMIFSRILGPGERSAVFGMNSRLNNELEDPLRLCFFYLNIGRAGNPYISRVELPAWAAEEQILDLLHGLLIEQCWILGGHPYPFILHRAHECAVVTMAEKEEVKGLLLREILENGMRMPEKSNKQIAKDASRLG